MAAGDKTPGRRLDREPDGLGESGDYYKTDDGWRGWVPSLPESMLANLSAHTVFEHEDGTISVSPSILVTRAGSRNYSWHGYLERGVWREV